ncbi:MAG: ABC transporter ATP-binding protein [Bavariicoccus seileri]|uniref:Peptide ABC transporter ATP-binding protein n=1 Tax=Bavariicoccus seileri TaxID=549685 RepID=A0A3D4S4X7_9ENTE|nr:ABC transporter ATP-binding protein [Bavariicoccus seileri]HCS93863.1 peptide ABC transporter ATP-binding protein [Bavariicoccus seileri]
MTTKPLIQMNNIGKMFGEDEYQHSVLEGIDLTINKGDFLMILGKSGSGKTTLMNIIGFLDDLSTGDYLFLGQKVSELKETKKAELRNQYIGFIFQQFFLIESLNIKQNIELPLVYSGIHSKKERKKKAKHYLDLVGIGDKMTAKTTQLSGGQQQRAAIARALINEPLMIMADEPTGALDSETSLAIMTLLKDLNQQGITIVMVTHDEDLLRYATRVVRISDGQLTEEGIA